MSGMILVDMLELVEKAKKSSWEQMRLSFDNDFDRLVVEKWGDINDQIIFLGLAIKKILAKLSEEEKK